MPKGYTAPKGVTDLTRAPGLETRLISEHPNGERTYALIFGNGDEIMSGLTEFAVREKLVGGHFSAIGALEHALFGWFDNERKAFRNISIDEQVEMVSLIGDLGLVNGSPAIHAHGAVAYPDGHVRGGHILEAVAWPTMELFFTAYPPYGFTGDITVTPPQYGFYNGRSTPGLSGQIPNLDLGTAADVKDRYEIMAFASEPRCRALGTTSNTAGFDSTNLQDLWPSDPFETDPTKLYSDHPWHSAQFRFTNADQHSYWYSALSQLTGQLGIAP